MTHVVMSKNIILQIDVNYFKNILTLLDSFYETNKTPTYFPVNLYISTSHSGGGLTIRFDEDKFESYLEMNPSVETVDDLLLSIVQSDLISKKDLLHCDLQGSLLDNGDLFISLEALNKYESYCLNLAKKITNVINSLSQAGETISASNFTAIPQVYAICNNASYLLTSICNNIQVKTSHDLTYYFKMPVYFQFNNPPLHGVYNNQQWIMYIFDCYLIRSFSLPWWLRRLLSL